ncbi:predicted protein [Naegleria gruberi]|uniref:Predicted protein n=1 Tax=Naegleria gruberi TaxID=5762 RepID=D2V907_NAEGR|nr:uncharacterized protein NAEGRDRAFT_79050 [Naegleria gruberi]EFC46783.1 predicted protein [Naegleria gruberi]|eukprot:XP_002679527.1 predicted protein [Naegleria gruberi strain NEG-M]
MSHSSLIGSSVEFLQALEQVGKQAGTESSSSYVAQERFLGSKDLIKTRFGDDKSALERVVVDLMDSSKTPLIRDQRIGVKLAIHQQVNKSGLRALLLADQSRTLSDLIAAHVHQVFTNEELLNLFDDENLSEHTRVRVEKTIRNECKNLILDVVKKIIGKVKPSECVVLLSHLPSSTPSEAILELLNELKLETLEGSVIVRKHPEVVAKFIRQELDKTIKGAVPQVSLWNLLIATLNELSSVFNTLSKVNPTLAFAIIDEYFVQYALKEDIPVDAVQSYLLLKVKNFPETFKSCINSKSKIQLNVSQLLKMFSIEDVAGIYLKKLETLNYATSPESSAFLRSFEVYDNRDAKKVVILISKLVAKGATVEKLSDWIFRNVQPSTDIPSFLKYFPLPVIHSVATKLYEVRKLKDFSTPDQESRYWRYMNMVEEEASYKKFKGSCSNSNSNVRLNVLLDLFFCSLLHNKRVKETLEFMDSRLKNDVESIPTVISTLSSDIFFATKIFSLYKNEEYREALHTLLENTAKKSEAPWYYRNFFSSVFRYYKDDITVLKFLIEKTSNFAKFNDMGFIGLYGVTLKPEIHKVVSEILFQSMINKIESEGNPQILRDVLNLGRYKKQPKHVKELYQKFFDEWIPLIFKKDPYIGSVNDIANGAFKGIEKKEAIELVKKVLAYEAAFIMCDRVQKLLLSRTTNLETDFIFKFIREKALTGAELQALSSSGFIHSDYVAAILPQYLGSLRLEEFASPELTRRLISTYENLLFRCGRVNPISFCSTYNAKKDEEKVEQDEEEDVEEDDEQEPVEAGEETVKMDVEDNATRCLASLVRIYSQNPVEHLQYVLENISSENVLYYFSAIGRISTFYNDVKFIDAYCAILKKQFTEVLTSKQPLPTNMSIAVQKMLISRLKAYVQHLNSEIPSKIVDTLVQIWDLKPQKDVQVAILSTILLAIKNDRTDQLYNKAKSILEQATTHEYEDIVLALAGFGPTKNVTTMREIFSLRLKTLEHPTSKIQTSAWSTVSSSATTPSFIKRVASESFNPIALFRKYIVDAVLTFNPQQQHNIANVAIDVLLKEIIQTPEEAGSILLDSILVPLLTEEKYQKLDRETYNADITWDRPVKARLAHIVNSLSTKVASTYLLISDSNKQTIQSKIVLPLVEVVKKHVQNRLPYVCIVSSINTNWNDVDSVVQNSIKNVADLLSDVEEPLKTLILSKIVNHSHQITLNRSNVNVLLDAVAKVLNNASEFSQTEQIIATGILMSLGTADDKTRELKKIARKSNVLNLLTE